MPFLNSLIKGVQNASKVVQAGVRATGRAIHKGAKAAYDNRDLIAKGVSLAVPVATGAAAGFAKGGVGGAIAGGGAAIAAEKDDISGFVKDVGKRVRGETKGGDIDPRVKDDLKQKAINKIPGVGGGGGGKKMDKSTRNRLKTLAQGQEV